MSVVPSYLRQFRMYVAESLLAGPGLVGKVRSLKDFKFPKHRETGNWCMSKEAIRKLVYKQTMWRVYTRTRKDEDYTNYKEALTAATTEIKKLKRRYKQTLACNITNDSKKCYT